MADLFVPSSPEASATPGTAGKPAPEVDAPRSTEEDNRRLRERYAEIAQLAGGLAHEIRNPLSTMSLNLDLLAEDLRSADRRVQDKIQRVRKETRRLQDIVENFLRYARVQELRYQAADLNLVVEELRDFYEPQAMAQGIVFRTYYAPDLPRVNLDVELFRQALLNLLINARQAMPGGGELMLRTRAEGPWCVLEVTDTGVGMSDEVRERVFEAFFTTRPAGSGLGLATTRRIVEAHGGTIGVRSEPGRGSQFTLRLPAASPAPTAPPAA